MLTLSDFSTSHVADLDAGLAWRQIDQLYQYFLQYMTAMGSASRKDGATLLRRRVVSSAALYFRWFYSGSSFSATDPRAMALAALFLASKVQEMPLHAKGLMHTAGALAAGAGHRWHIPAALPAVLTAEAELLSVVGGALLTYDPLPSLLEGLESAGLHANKDLVLTAWSLLNDSYLCKVHLLYPPHTIALACVVLAAASHGKDIEEWLAGLDIDHAQVYEAGQSVLSTVSTTGPTISSNMCNQYLALLRLSPA